MLTMFAWLLRRINVRDERGEVYVEYTVLGALAVLVILGAVQYFFGGLSFLFTKMGDAVRGIG
ncbi:MAG: Flp family type IVb pilin [Burkholderiales bacterium]